MNDASKVTPGHIQRAAFVYIRQSTPAQVEYNRESTARQYGLAEKALQLGWAKEQVIVIDEDLGVSGSGFANRSGFARMTAASSGLDDESCQDLDGEAFVLSEESVMSKFKIEKGVSRINRVKLQASIEESLATELALMCEWSNNDRNYVVNELLRFALSQDSEFQAYKESAVSLGRGRAQTPTGPTRPRTGTAANAESEIEESVSYGRQ